MSLVFLELKKNKWNTKNIWHGGSHHLVCPNAILEMPGQRHPSKSKLSMWVQNMDEVEAYAKKTGKTKTEVIQELINELKETQRKARIKWMR